MITNKYERDTNDLRIEQWSIWQESTNTNKNLLLSKIRLPARANAPEHQGGVPGSQGVSDGNANAGNISSLNGIASVLNFVKGAFATALVEGEYTLVVATRSGLVGETKPRVFTKNVKVNAYAPPPPAVTDIHQGEDPAGDVRFSGE